MLSHLPGLRVRRALLGPALQPTNNVWMTFEEGLIAAIGTGPAPVSLPEAPGPVLMPGLVDCHVHLAMSGGPDVVSHLADLDRLAIEEAVMANARAQVLSGVTTVRDLGSPNDLVVSMTPKLGRSQDLAPTVVAASAISSPDGHGHFLARHATGPDQYQEVVATLAASGARFVKLFATGGVITQGTVPGGIQMTPMELNAAVNTAHRLNLRVAVHAHGLAGIRNAITAGVESIEHFSYLTDDAACLACHSRTWLVSTLVATERFVAAEDRQLAAVETLNKILEHAPHERTSLARAVRSGCRLAVGTDAGTTFNPHGHGMQEQALLLRSAGMPIREILRALTVHGADLLGEPTGSLEVGRTADLLCLGSDPSDRLSALNDIRAVILRARVVEEASTWQP